MSRPQHCADRGGVPARAAVGGRHAVVVEARAAMARRDCPSLRAAMIRCTTSSWSMRGRPIAFRGPSSPRAPRGCAGRSGVGPAARTWRRCWNAEDDRAPRWDRSRTCSLRPPAPSARLVEAEVAAERTRAAISSSLAGLLPGKTGPHWDPICSHYNETPANARISEVGDTGLEPLSGVTLGQIWRSRAVPNAARCCLIPSDCDAERDIGAPQGPSATARQPGRVER
jgi:hypothetical protein